MPITNQWLVPERVLETRLSGDITVEELVASAQTGTRMIEAEGIAPVFSLVDMTHIERYPIRISDMRTVYSQGTSNKLTWIIVFGIPNNVVNFMATMFTRLIKLQYRVVKTQDEALALVDKLMLTSKSNPDH
jgi:hypothetical protein